MKNPQTLAIELNKDFPNPRLKAIGDYACCAFTLLWCLGIEPDDITAIQTVSDLMKDGALDNECTVYWADCIENLTGRKLKKLEKVPITSIKKIKNRTPVFYTYNGKGHWVGVENGRIAFNSLKESVCVSQGKPTEMRVIYIN